MKISIKVWQWAGTEAGRQIIRNAMVGEMAYLATNAYTGGEITPGGVITAPIGANKLKYFGPAVYAVGNQVIDKMLGTLPKNYKGKINLNEMVSDLVLNYSFLGLSEWADSVIPSIRMAYYKELFRNRKAYPLGQRNAYVRMFEKQFDNPTFTPFIQTKVLPVGVPFSNEFLDSKVDK